MRMCRRVRSWRRVRSVHNVLWMALVYFYASMCRRLRVRQVRIVRSGFFCPFSNFVWFSCLFVFFSCLFVFFSCLFVFFSCLFGLFSFLCVLVFCFDKFYCLANQHLCWRFKAHHSPTK